MRHFLFSLISLFAGTGLLLAAENYEGKDLEKQDFREKNLTGANFSDSTCRYCYFNRTILKDANFEDADLRQASFYMASAEGANFKGVILAGGTSFNDANLSGANFEGVNFNGVPVSNVNFRNANLRNTTGFAGADNCNFRGADLRGANLSGMTYHLAKNYQNLQFKGARYDAKTVFPKGYDPKEEGAVLVED